MADQIKPDPYNGIISLRDFNDYMRGWDAYRPPTTMQVSRYTTKQVMPEGMNAMAPTTSRTLSRPLSEPAQTLPPDVQLRITGNATLTAAIKFAQPFTDLIPFSVEQNALVCLQQKTTPNLILNIIIPYTDVQGIVSPQLTPGSEYAMKRITATSITRLLPTFDFKNDGVIEQKSAASTVTVSGTSPSTKKARAEAEELIKRISAQATIASAWVHSGPLEAVFPTKKVKNEQDRDISITPSGIKISGVIDGKPASLLLRCDEGAAGCTDYGFRVLPKQSLQGKLLMAGLTQLGRCMTTGSATGVSLTFHEKVGTYYYLCISVPFTSTSSSSGSAYIPIVGTTRVGLPPVMSSSLSHMLTPSDTGDQAVVSAPLIQSGVPSKNLYEYTGEESEEEDEDAEQDEEDVAPAAAAQKQGKERSQEPDFGDDADGEGADFQ
jgi:hypothetical protein